MVMTEDRPVTRDRANDALIAQQHQQLARMLGQAKGKISERAMYYRKPPGGVEGGWIIVAGTNPERQQGLFMKGIVPLQRYGFVDPQSARGPDGETHPDPSYRQWAKLLLAPGGAGEFPVDQLVAYRWYDPAICPVPTARFPQLEGIQVTKFWCPECDDVYYHKATHLGRHLRIIHEYDRAEIIAYGHEAGISFAKELIGGRQAVEAVAYVMPPEPEPPEPLPVIESEDIRAASPRRGRRSTQDMDGV